MKRTSFSVILVLLLCSGKLNAQAAREVETGREKKILDSLKARIVEADTTTKMLLTRIGFNVLMQRRSFNYLTGASDLLLAKFYGGYSSENDKLNLGFNIPTQNPYTQRLKWVLNPLFEMDVKNGFATVFKDTAWKNNIRLGFKVTYLTGKRGLKFWSTGTRIRKNDFRILRTKKYVEISTKLDKEKKEKTDPAKLFYDTTLIVYHDSKGWTKKEWDKKEKEIYEDFGKMEADLVDKELTYNRIRSFWWSAWCYFPLTKTEQFITPNVSTAFTKTRFNLWELNFQASYLYDVRRSGSFYFSAWFKYFQNNSASASLMKPVDYQQYATLPGPNPLNLALLENNKGYIGNYDEFMTGNLNLQVLYFLPIYNTLVKPGASVRLEKNWGKYHPLDLRLGLPINLQGKDKPINFELQYRITDINNYRKLDDHKTGKTIGIGVGFPFVALYK